MMAEKIKTRINDILLSAMFLTFTFFGFGTIELFMTNRSEFWFDYSSMLLWIFFFLLISIVLVFVISIFLPDTIYRHIIVFFYTFSLMIYIQGNFLPNNYGSLNGEEIVWSAYFVRGIVNTIIWVFFLTLPQVFLLISGDIKRILYIARIVSFVVLMTQIVTIIFLFINPISEKKESPAYLSDEGMFGLSSSHNTVVILLDCFDAQLMYDLLEKYDYLEKDFEGFTFYRDTVGGATRTKYAIPYIFTGKTNTTGGTYSEYIEREYSESPFIEELKNSDYDARIFTSCYGYVDCNESDAIDNAERGKIGVSSPLGLTELFLKVTAFRYSPHLLKRFFWSYSGDFNAFKGSVRGNNNPYAYKDVDFYQALKDQKLSVITENNVFRFYHLDGAHGPYYYDENVMEVDASSEEKQALGALKIAKEYIEQLKQLGVYEITDIIIMADHGYSNYSKYEQNPLFMLNDGLGELYVSDKQLSYASMPKIMLSSINSCITIEGEEMVDNQRYFYCASETGNKTTITEYVTSSEAWESEKMVRTGTIYENGYNNIDYEIGKQLFFGSDYGNTIADYLVRGWSNAEKKHMWNYGTKSLLKFQTEKNTNYKVTFNYAMVADGMQRVNVYVNGNEVEFYIADAPMEKSIYIPKEYVLDGIIELEFRFPDASAHIEKGDPRPIALAFTSIKIDKISDKEYLENVDDRQQSGYILGKQIWFSNEEDITNYIEYGVGKDSWIYEKAGFSFGIVDFDKKTPLELELCFDRVKNEKQNVIIYINNQTIGTSVVEEGNSKLVMPIPEGVVSDEGISVCIECPDAAVPDNGDARRLSLHMQSISIMPRK